MKQNKQFVKSNKKNAGSSVDSRDLVLEALLVIGKEQEYSHVVVRGLLQKYNYLDGKEKAFIKRLIEGTLERRIELDYCIDAVSKTPVRKMKPFIRELMRMSTYQLLYMDSVPDSAVCNEAVKLAQKHSFGSLKGFVNGVLRNLSRQKENIAYPDEKEQPVKALSVRYSMPEWLIEKFEREQGKEITKKILDGLLCERPVTLRVREKLLSDDNRAELKEILAQLKERGAGIEKNRYLPYAFEIKKTEDIGSFLAFAEGKCTVQDVSSMLAVEAAGIHEGDYVIDVCSAPGGKMLFASERASAGGRILARDVSDYKLAMMLENKNRMSADNVTLQLWNACVLDEEQIGKADVVLVDVPCSGLGVIGRKRDIKYRLTLEGMKSLLPLQKEILQTVQQYVKPGGTLLYSTCTINKQENEEMVKWFALEFPFHFESLAPYFPKALNGSAGSETIEKGYFQFLPGIHGTDGFFVARLKKD